MLKRLVFGVSGCVIVSLCAATLAAPQQDRPGVVEPARVWIQNRDRTEAIPVVLQESDPGKPFDVRIAGPTTVTLAAGTIVQAQFTRQAWEYRTITIRSGQDLASALARAGIEGWEATGVQTTDQSGVSVLLKRPL